jgi:hypothetical protein
LLQSFLAATNCSDPKAVAAPADGQGLKHLKGKRLRSGAENTIDIGIPTHHKMRRSAQSLPACTGSMPCGAQAEYLSETDQSEAEESASQRSASQD